MGESRWGMRDTFSSGYLQRKQKRRGEIYEINRELLIRVLWGR